jgi:hypothetical protein
MENTLHMLTLKIRFCLAKFWGQKAKNKILVKA